MQNYGVIGGSSIFGVAKPLLCVRASCYLSNVRRPLYLTGCAPEATGSVYDELLIIKDSDGEGEILVLTEKKQLVAES